MPGEAYNAGTIFLQVVPVFGDLQNAIRREAKDANRALGDEMEKGGRDAGRRGSDAMGEEMSKGGDKNAEKYIGAFASRYRDGMRKLNKELESSKVRIHVEDDEINRSFDQIARRAKGLRDIKVGVDISSKEAVTELARLELQLRLLEESAKDIQIKADLKSARANVAAFTKEIQAQHPEIKIDADFSKAHRALGSFEQAFSDRIKKASGSLGSSLEPEIRRLKGELDSLGNADIGVDIHDDDAKAALAFLIAEMHAIDSDTLTISARANVGKALAELELLHAEIRAIDGDEINVKVDKANQGVGDTANNFRALNGVILTAVLLGSALIPVIAALGGALLALSPIVASLAGGIGVMILGFSGIGTAVQAMGQHQKQGAAEAQTAAARIKSAARGVADAERALSDAERQTSQQNADAARNLANVRRDVARRNVDAARSVADAERSSAQAVQSALQQRADAVRNAAQADRDAAQAQRDLVKAREDAKKQLEDGRRSLAENKLAERQGVVDLFQATVADQQTRQDGSATNLQKEQAAIDLGNARLRLATIRAQGKELAKQQKQGVSGAQGVKSAQDTLTQALERQADAHRAVGRASAAVDRARINGARQVANAVRDQQRAQADGQRQIDDALRTQHRTQVDGARSIATAQRNLTRQQQDYQIALHQSSSSALAVKDAMSKLSPEGRKFARYLFSLRQGFYDIRDAAQRGMLPGVQASFQTIISHYGKRFTNFVYRMSRVWGNLFRDMGRAMTGPVMEKFFRTINRIGPSITRQFGHAALNWMKVFARLMTIAAPWAQRLSTALLHVSQHALAFTKSKSGTKKIQDFLAYAAKVGPKVWRFFKDLFAALVNIGRAMGPVGELILAALDGFLRWIAGMNPKVLAAILTVIIAFVVTFQALNGVLALASIGTKLWLALLTPVLGPILLIVAAVVAIGAAIIYFYTQTKVGHRIIGAAFRGMGAVVKWVWEKILKPIFVALGKVANWLWHHILAPAFKAIGAAFKVLGFAFRLYWRYYLHPVLNALGTIAGWLWHHILKPVFKAIGIEWKIMSAIFRWAWKHFIWPILDLFGHIIGIVLWKGILKPVFGLIGRRWKDLAAGLKWAWDHIIHPMLKAFGDAFGFLRDRIKNIADKIGGIWDGIKKKLGKPINFVIKYVFNNGLIKGFNKVAKFVGSDPMPKMGYAKFRDGGMMPGYTPGRDVHRFYSPTGGRLDLSGGEPIMRPEFGRVVGRDWIDRMNAAARRGGVSGVQRALYEGQAFASGGVIDGKRLSKIAIKQIRLAEKVGHIHLHVMQGGYGGSHIAASGTSHNYPGVADVSPGSYFVEKLLRRVGFAAWARNIRGRRSVGSGAHVHSVSLLDPGDARSPQVYGSWARHGDGLGGSHDPAPHYPWLPNLRKLVGGTSLLGKIGGLLGQAIPGWLGKAVHHGLDWAKDKITGPLQSLASKFGHNKFVQFLGSTAHKLLSPIVDKVKSIFGHSDIAKATGPSALDIASIHGAVRHQVNAVASMYGWQAGPEWAALSKIISSESSWNPRAANTESSARGLFQKMTSLYGPIEKTAAGQARWGLHYIKHRYGDPIKAWAYHRRHGTYADGGVVGDHGEAGGETGGVSSNGTMAYDSGGYLPPGITQVVNLTGKPEPVFTADQFDRLGATGTEGGAASYTYSPTFNASDLTAEDVAGDMLHGFRIMENRGKYGGPQ